MRLVSEACETGGRWSDECRTVLRGLAAERARAAPLSMRHDARAHWQRRQSTLHSVGQRDALAATLVDDVPVDLDGADGEPPDEVSVWLVGSAWLDSTLPHLSSATERRGKHKNTPSMHGRRWRSACARTLLLGRGAVSDVVFEHALPSLEWGAVESGIEALVPELAPRTRWCHAEALAVAPVRGGAPRRQGCRAGRPAWLVAVRGRLGANFG